MSKFKKEEEQDAFETPRFPTYSKQELYQFRDELEKYRIHKVASTGEKLSFVDFDAYLKSQKALSRTGAVYVNHIYPNTKVTFYEALNNKLDQLGDLLSKVEYAKKMELEGLDEFVDSFKVQI